MNLKKILFCLCFTVTQINFCLDTNLQQDLAKYIHEEVNKAIQRHDVMQKRDPIIIQNHIHNASASTSSSNPTTSTNAINEIEVQIKNTGEILPKPTETTNIDIQEILNAYKWYIGGGIITTSYLYIFYKIYQTNKLLNNPYSWALFKEEIPVTRLATVKRTDLFQELHLAICKKYLNSSSYDNDKKVMLKFLTDLSFEKAALESYLTYQTVIYNCYLSKLFPTFKKPEQIQEAISRLNFLMDLYIEFFIIKDQIK